MLIACPHCQQQLQVEEAWAGLEVDCPLCQGKLIVPGPPAIAPAAPPARPAGNTRRKTNYSLEAWKRQQRARRMFSVVLLLALLGGAALLFNHYRGERPPAEAFRHFAQQVVDWFNTRFFTPPPAPTPTPTPTPEPTPELTPTPEPTPVPTPEPLDPVAWLMDNPDRRPPILVLREPVMFPALYEGRVVGKVKVPSGAKVKLVEIRPDAIEVRFRDGTAKVAYDATNLRELAAEEMAKPLPEPTPEVAEAPSPLPKAPAEPASRDDVLGPTVQRDKDGNISGTTFRVWAPNAESVSVVGSFNRWKPESDKMTLDKDTGVWIAEVAKAKPGDEYIYLINGDLERRDPRGRELSGAGKSVVHDPSAFDWEGVTSPQSELRDLVIYQLHPGTFHDPEPGDGRMATLRDAIGKLDHLQELGVNCVLLMPVAEFAGDHSWGYNPSDPYSIERAYGGPEALREFVKEAHRRGIAVHVDAVHNHYGPDDLDLKQFDGYGGGDNSHGIYFYEDEDRGSTSWGPRPDFSRPEVRAYIADQIRMLFDEYRIDGIRWDSVVNIVRYNDGASDNADGEKLIDELSQMIRSEYPGKLSIAEDAVGDERFDGSWEYGFHHAGEAGELGVASQLLRPSGETDVADIASRLQSDLGFARVVYTENHDETGKLNGKERLITGVDGSDPHSLTARRKNALAAVLTLTAPGVPLLFMGQETLETAEFHDSNPIDWERGEVSSRSTKLYRDLVRLRRNLDGRSGALQDTKIRIMEEDPARQLLVYRRFLAGEPDDDLVIAVNFSPEPMEDLPLTLPRAADWEVLLDTDDEKYGEGFTGPTAATRGSGGNTVSVSLAPFSAKIIGVKKR